MLAPGHVCYYFTVDGEVMMGEDHQVLDVGTEIYSARLKKLKVPRTNYIENIAKSDALVTKLYLEKMKCVPRPPPVGLKGHNRIKTPWDFMKSVFSPYKPDR